MIYNMNSMVQVRARALEIAASVKDVSSENIIDVADKIAKYIKRDVNIPEYVGAYDVATAIMDKVVQHAEKDFYKTPSIVPDGPLAMFGTIQQNK